MYLEIVSPEATLFNADVESVALPGIQGDFQILKNHASIVSLLTEGTIKIYTSNPLDLENLHADIVSTTKDNKAFTLKINSGTVEMKDNKAIVLVD